MPFFFIMSSKSFIGAACLYDKEVVQYEAGEISFEELLGGKPGYHVFHELGHVLDMGNIYYDADGNRVEESLPEPDDLAEYERRVQKLEQHLSKITRLKSVF